MKSLIVEKHRAHSDTITGTRVLDDATDKQGMLNEPEVPGVVLDQCIQAKKQRKESNEKRSKRDGGK